MKRNIFSSLKQASCPCSFKNSRRATVQTGLLAQTHFGTQRKTDLPVVTHSERAQPVQSWKSSAGSPQLLPHTACSVPKGGNSQVPRPTICFYGIHMGTVERSSECSNSSWVSWQHHKQPSLNIVLTVCRAGAPRVGWLAKGTI